MSIGLRSRNALRRCSLIIGRRNLYRASRFLMAAAQGDVTNDPRFNGEAMVQESVLKMASAPGIIFDVGANTGDWTAMLLETAQCLSAAVLVHAFEPSRPTFLKLVARVSGWPSVTPVNAACSSESGTATLTVNKDAPRTNSLVPRLDSRQSETESVKLTSIDDYCSAHSISHIDLLKIDAEGHDVEVLLGSCRMLQSGSIKVVQFEYNQRWIASRRYLRDAFSLLKPLGYEIGKVAGAHVEFYPEWEWEMENYREANFIACSGSIADRFPSVEPGWVSFEGRE